MNRKYGFFVKLLALLAGICLLTGLLWMADTGFGVLSAAVAEGGDGHSGSSEDHGNEADGSKIESIHIHWITPDSPDDSVADNLYLRTSDTSELRMRYQIDVSFSGEFDYEPGNIRVNIPKAIWHKRANNSETGATQTALYGGLSLSVPDASSNKTDWHYEINSDGSYSIVNTNTIAATSKAMFQFTITEIYPQYIVDESVSDDLMARVEVVTAEGNTIYLDSNVLTAQIDTEEKLTSGSKGGTLYEFADDVPAALLANLPAGTKSSDYLYVKWYVYPYFYGNQYFSLSASDTGSRSGIDDTEAYIGVYKEVVDPETGKRTGWEHCGGAVMLGAVNSGGSVVGSVSNNEWTNDIITRNFTENGTRQYNNVRYVWTAYKKSDFPELNVNYQFRNQAYWELVEQDPKADYPAALGGTDPKKVTTASAKDSVEYFQADWHYPPGRFLSFKYTESSIGHKHSLSSSDEWNNTTHKKNYTYDLALNRLLKGQSTIMNYEVLSVGYGGIFTCGPLAGTIGWQDENGGQHEGHLDSAYNENWNSAAWADDMDHYLNWYYVMDTTDRWEWFSVVDGNENTRLKKSRSDDYRFLGITIASPEIFQWDKQRDPKYYFANTTYGFAPDETLPKPAVEVWVEFDNKATITDTVDTREPSEATGWHYVGSYVVESGKTQYVDFTGLGNVTGYRTRISSNQAATKLAVYPKIELKPSDRVIEIVQQLFEESESPSTPYRNDENMYVELYKYPENPENTAPQQAYYIPKSKYYRQFINHDDSRATLTGGGYGVSPSKAVNFSAITDNDPENRCVHLHYTATVTEASNVHTVGAWQEAVTLGAIKAENGGAWYDLLPEGVRPVISSVKPARSGDKITSVKTYPNWRNTGRIMLVVEMDLKPSPRTNSAGVIIDEPGIKFNADYDWTDINNIGARLVNYIAFESGDDEKLGTLKGRIGEPDAMEKVNNNWTPTGEPQTIVDAYRDLDPTSDKERFVYAKAVVNLNVDQMAQTEYAKAVQSDLDGIWTQGLEGQTQVNLYEGQAYTYRLRVASCKDTITSNMVMYDSLENYIMPSGLDEDKDKTKLADYNEVQSKKDWDGDWDRKTIQVGAAGNKEDLEVGGQWRGKLVSIDVNDLIRQGCAPVIYYATEPWLQFGDTTGSVVDETIFFNYIGRYDLTDECWKKVPASAVVDGIWTVPEGTDVTAIALDLRKDVNGGSFELHSQEAAYALLHMVAPDDHEDETQWHAKGAYAHKNADGSASSNEDIDWEKALDPKNNMHAYNNTRLICSQADEENPSASSRITMIRNDYTRIGIMPRIIMVEKVWDDDENHDNKRPDSVTVTMKRKLKTQTKWQTVMNETTGKPLTVTLSEKNDWKDIFYQQDAVDEKGREWEYTFEENTIPGYTKAAQKIDDTHFRLTNSHENEKTEVSGRKLWRMNDGQMLPASVESLLPSSVTVKLYRTGKSGEKEYVKSLTVRPNEDGEWKYAFTDLDKYERGGFEYDYSVEEMPVKYFFSSTQDPSVLPEGYDITVPYDPEDIELIYNFYFPFGDLQMDKNILGATAVSKTQEFTYTLMLEGGDGQPVAGEFNYTIYSVATDADTGAETLTAVSTGKIAHDGTFKLKGGQRIIVKKLPADAKYSLTEADEEGWTMKGSTRASGTVPTASTVTASFTNQYRASGSATVSVKKSLTGHKLKRNQFQFELVDMTEGSETCGEAIRKNGNSVPADTAQDADTGVITNTSEFRFSAVSYTEKDHGKTFTYEIHEVIPEGAEDQGDGTFLLDGYTYDAAVRTVTVKVTDNGDGTMTTVVSPDDPSENLFNNVYTAEGDVTLKVFKTLLKRDLEDREFEFELWKSDETGAEIEKIEDGVRNDEEGGVTFTTLHFTQDDVSLDPENPAKYYYLVKETRGTDPTVIYTETSHLFTITVYDQGNGKLTFAREGQEVEFEHDKCASCGGSGKLGGLMFDIFDWNADGKVYKYTGDKFSFGNQLEIPVNTTDVFTIDICQACNGSGLNPDDPEGSTECLVCRGFGTTLADVIQNLGSAFTNMNIGPIELPDGRVATIITPLLVTEVASWARNDGYTDEQIEALYAGMINPYFVYGCYVFDDMEKFLQWNGNFEGAGITQGAYLYIAGDGDECPDCEGLGYTLGNPIVSADTNAVPLFTNDLKDGALKVTKTVTTPDPKNPDQEFTFHVKLTGEYARDHSYSSTMPSNLKPVPDPVLPPQPQRPRADSLDSSGDAYAVLDKNTGTLTFYRSETRSDPDGTALPEFSEVGGCMLLETDDKVYFTHFEDGLDAHYGWNSYSLGYNMLVKTVEMRDRVTLGATDGQSSSYSLFSNCRNIESVTLDKLDLTGMHTYNSYNGTTKPLTVINMYYLIPGYSSTITKLDMAGAVVPGLEVTSFRDYTNMEELYLPTLVAGGTWNSYGGFQGMPKLKYLDLSPLKDGICINLNQSFQNSGYVMLDLSPITNYDIVGQGQQNFYTFMNGSKDLVSINYGILGQDQNALVHALPAGPLRVTIGSDDPPLASDQNPSFATAEYTDLWVPAGQETNPDAETLTSKELLTTPGHKGEWVRLQRSYRISANDGDHSGSIFSGTVSASEDYVFMPNAVYNGYKLAGVKDKNTGEVFPVNEYGAVSLDGKVYPVSADGTVTIDGTAYPVENGTVTISAARVRLLNTALTPSLAINGEYEKVDTGILFVSDGVKYPDAKYWQADHIKISPTTSTYSKVYHDGIVKNGDQLLPNANGQLCLPIREDTDGSEYVEINGNKITLLDYYVYETISGKSHYYPCYKNDDGTFTVNGETYTQNGNYISNETGKRFYLFGGTYKILLDPSDDTMHVTSTTAYSVTNFSYRCMRLPGKREEDGSLTYTYNGEVLPFETTDQNIGFVYNDKEDPSGHMIGHYWKYGEIVMPDGSHYYIDEDYMLSSVLSEENPYIPSQTTHYFVINDVTLEVNQPGTITIPVSVYENGDEVELELLWERMEEEVDTESAEFTFTLKAGESKVFDPVAASTAYEVWEETPRGWILVGKSGDSGAIEPLVTSEVELTNEYAPNKTTASLTASKRLDGRMSRRAFTFGLYEVAADGTETLKDTKENTVGGVASFDIITYDLQKDPTAEGTHTYIIREIPDDPEDVTIVYDGHEETVSVLVEKVDDPDAPNGFIAQSTVKYQDEEGNKSNGIFMNTTRPGNLQISKTVTGASEIAAKAEFTVALTLQTKDYAGMAGIFTMIRTAEDGTETEETVTTSGSGKANLTIHGGETLLIKDLPVGTRYSLEETGIPAAWTQTNAEGESGKIVSVETAEVSYENAYSMKGEASFRAEKQVDGEDKVPEGYSFELVDNTEGSDNYGQVIETAVNAATGEEEKVYDTVSGEEIDNPDYGKALVKFTRLQYTAEGTYSYLIREIAPAEGDAAYDPKMVYDSREIKVTVKATDTDGKGKLTTTVTYADGEGADKNAFLNTFKPGNLQISKSIENATEVSAGQEFTVNVLLKDRDGNGLAGSYDVTRTDTEGRETKETLAVKEGKAELILKGGETVLINGLPDKSTWLLAEQEEDGWTQTDAQGTAGTIESDETGEAAFRNTYHAEGKAVLKARKEMDPADIPIQEKMFSFILRDEKGGELQRVENDADGTGTFEEITYSQKDAGKTFTYSILEQQGVNRATKKRYSFDTASYIVKVTVTDNGDGTMDTETVYSLDGSECEEAVFINSSSVNIPIRKVWKQDEEVAEVTRPEYVLVELLANGKVIATRSVSVNMALEEGGTVWETMFAGMPEYKDGKKVEYTLREVEETARAYLAYASADDDTLVVTNEYHETSVILGGVKKMVNRSMKGGEFSFTIRPKEDSGTEEVPLPEDPTAVNEADGTFTFGEITYHLSDLDWDENGHRKTSAKKTYIISEDIPEGAELSEDGKHYVFNDVLYDSGEYEVTVTLKVNPETGEFTAEADLEPEEIVFRNEALKTNITATKTWDDNDDHDEKRSGVKAAFVLLRTVNGKTEELETAEVAPEDNWSVTWENLPVRENGEKITYSVKEILEEANGYTSDTEEAVTVENGGAVTITNSYTPETTEITAKKIWNDADDQDGRRSGVKAKAVLIRTVDGKTEDAETAEITAENNWSKTWKQLPVYEGGKRITYSVKETLEEANGYNSDTEEAVTVENGGIVIITNSHMPETTEITVKKVWNDAENQDGKREDVKAAVVLVQIIGGKTEDLETAEVTSVDDWSVTWEDLPVCRNGEKITYSVKETLEEANGYTSDTAEPVIAENGGSITITNSYTPETTEITVKKVWDDNEDQFDRRIGVKATVTLMRTVAEKTEDVETARVGESDDWTVTWENLPVYEDGIKIVYSVKETLEEANGYTSDTEEAVTAENGGIVTITNRYSAETVQTTVKKVWDDQNDKAGKRPESLTVILSDGTEYELNEGNEWTLTVTGLPKYDNAGKEIAYTWKEGTMPEGYSMSKRSESGTVTTFTNKLKEKEKPAPGPVAPRYGFTFTKEWEGGKEDSITVTLYNPDGTKHKHGFSKKVLNSTTWQYTAYLSQIKDYYVIEEEIPGYKTKYVNTGKYADVTDRCYSGGKIINYKVPKTGDPVNLPLVMTLVVFSALGLTFMIRKEKKQRKEQKKTISM